MRWEYFSGWTTKLGKSMMWATRGNPVLGCAASTSNDDSEGLKQQIVPKL
jgi:hypothetical protein